MATITKWSNVAVSVQSAIAAAVTDRKSVV